MTTDYPVSEVMDKIEKRARELLAAEYERDGHLGVAHTLRYGYRLTPAQDKGLAAIAAALRSAQVLANRWQDEAAGSWGKTKEHAMLQRCADELRALLSAAKRSRIE